MRGDELVILGLNRLEWEFGQVDCTAFVEVEDIGTVIALAHRLGAEGSLAVDDLKEIGNSMEASVIGEFSIVATERDVVLADQEVRSLLDGALAFVLEELGIGVDLPRCMGCAYVNEVPETILVSCRVVR